MRSNKWNNKLSYFLTLLLCLCMLVGCGSGAATQVMLKAEDSETESYVETVQTESAENDLGDETEIQAAAQVQSDDSKQKWFIPVPHQHLMQQMFRHIPGNHIQLSTIMNPILHRII
ncbi:MAG: hypothetical protein ACLR1V_18090 [Coprococcus sp.]